MPPGHTRPLGMDRDGISHENLNSPSRNVTMPFMSYKSPAKYSSPPYSYLPVDKRRHVHNICEKKRREHIREGFTLLQQRVPSSYPHYKMSKLEVLKGSIEHVTSLLKHISDLEAEVDGLVAEYAQACESKGRPLSAEELGKLKNDYTVSQ